ncbi:MAG: Spy0128 family protein [Suipraeoptans sp.]
MKKARRFIGAMCSLLLILTCVGVVDTKVDASSHALAKLPIEQEFNITGNGNINDIFYYNLISLENGNPMPNHVKSDIYKFSIRGNDEAGINPIEFTHVGIYHYVIEQIPTNSPGYVFDNERYQVTITVSNGENGALDVKEIAYTNANEKADKILFTNTYRRDLPLVSTKSSTIKKAYAHKPGSILTGDRNLWPTLILLILAGSAGTYMLVKKKTYKK